MKKYIYIIMCSAMIISMSSCNQYLEVYPENVEPTDKYWSTKEEVESALFSGYYYLRNSVEDYLIPWGELRAGCITNRSGSVLQKFELKPSSKVATWADMYKIINIANLVLANAELARTNDNTYTQEAMNSHFCEAYFLRALAYFYIARNWQSAPLNLQGYQSDDYDYNIPAVPNTEILTQIKTDLETAVKLGAAKTSFDTTWETKGRATIWSIYALLTDVCLWKADFDDAIKYANAILNSQDTSRPRFMSTPSRTSWFSMFNPGNSNESIFEIQWSYEKEDKSGYQSNNLPMLFYSGSSEYTYHFCDEMRDAYNQESLEIGENWMAQHPNPGPEETPDYIRSIYGTTDGNNLCWKYIGGAQGSATNRISEGKEDPNYIIYRVADVMLMKAEAIIMKDLETPNEADNQTAIDIINQIRTRTNLNPSELDAAFAGPTELLEAILHERVMEFAGEGKAWYDFLRFGHYTDPTGKIDFKRDFLINNVQIYNSSLSADKINSVLLNENAWYMPISADEIKANPLLSQNPYY